MFCTAAVHLALLAATQRNRLAESETIDQRISQGFLVSACGLPRLDKVHVSWRVMRCSRGKINTASKTLQSIPCANEHNEPVEIDDTSLTS